MIDIRKYENTDELSSNKKLQSEKFSKINMIEMQQGKMNPMDFASLKELVLSMGNDDFLIQLSLTEEEDESCL